MNCILLQLIFSIILNLCSALSSQTRKPLSSEGVRFRPGCKRDELTIATTMARELMNPLNIDATRFIVAVNPDPDRSNDLYGWAQIKPIGPSIRDPKDFNAGPGSGSIGENIDEEIWEEFEKDETDVPVGFASLPWTKEYREFSKASAARREKRAALVASAERETEEGRNQLWEVSSVFVLPAYRGRGIGSELVRRLLAKHAMLERRNLDVYLLTLATTKGWYQSLGFELTDDPPESMKFEMDAGNIITKLIGAELICMRGGSQ